MQKIKDVDDKNFTEKDYFKKYEYIGSDLNKFLIKDSVIKFSECKSIN